MRRLVVIGIVCVGPMASAQTIGRLEPGKGNGSELEKIDQVFRANAKKFKACFVKTMEKHPKFSGKFTYHLKVGADGKVTSARLHAPKKTIAMFDRCMVGALRSLELPPGTERTINYPFIFQQPT